MAERLLTNADEILSIVKSLPKNADKILSVVKSLPKCNEQLEISVHLPHN